MNAPFISRQLSRWLILLLPLLLIALLVFFSERQNRNTRTVATPPAASQQTSASPASAEFRKWMEEPNDRPASDREKHLSTGVALANARHERMVRLIRENPQQAIAEALDFEEWSALPPEVQARVEKPFSMVADYEFYPVCGRPGTGHPEGTPEYVAKLNLQDGSSLEAFVYGQRRDLMSKKNLPVQGITLDGMAVIQDGVFQKITITPTVDRLFPAGQADLGKSFVTGQPVASGAVHALAGGRIFTFSNETELANAESELAKLDAMPGPVAASSMLILPKGDGSTPATLDLGAIQTFATVQATSWTESKKTVFLIRVNFTNNTTIPVTQTAAATELNGPTSDMIRAMSYGKTWIEAAVSSNVYTLPQTSTYYSGSSLNSELLRDARNTFRNTKNGGDAAINIGPVSNSTNGDGGGLGNYDIVGIFFSNISISSGGVAYAGLAGGSNLWVQNANYTSLYVHELGHNYGLGHASFWQTSDGSVTGTGATVEYGDIYDVMGDGPVPEGHYHSQGKAKLNWLTTSEWTNATGSNTYRVYREDDPSTTGNPRGVRVTKVSGTNSEYYWISYKPAFSGNPHMKRGVHLAWQKANQTRSWLLDTTPGSAGGKDDAAIDLGRTYADATANVYITPLATGGSGSQSYLDVRVNTGPFPGNAAPAAASISGPATLPARSSATYTISATDSNGDPLAYYWSSGETVVNDNAASINLGWQSGGSYTLTATVSDMKGGTTTVSKTITVTDTAFTFTARTSNTVEDLYAIVHNATTAVAVGGSGTIRTSTDGVTWTTRTISSSANMHFRGAIWDGAKFIIVGNDYNFTIPDWVGIIYTSTDGITWTERYRGSVGNTELKAVASNGNGVVAVGEGGTVLKSTNGTSWSAVTISGITSSHELTGIASNGSIYVLTGYTLSGGSYNGGVRVFTSPDATVWTDRSAGAGIASWQDLRKIAWLNDRFVSSGWYSSLRTSTDGAQTFTTTRGNREENPAMAYGDGIYFTAGEDHDNSKADVDVYSTDGMNWASKAAPTTQNRSAATFFKHTFITVGNSGTIFQSGSTAPAGTYAEWQFSQFTSGRASTIFTGDPDQDGVENLMEYALNRNPNLGTGQEGPPGISSTTTLAGKPRLHLEMPEPAMGDVTYTVQGTTNLTDSWAPLARKTGTGAWTWLGGNTSRILTGTTTNGRQPVDIGIPDSAASATKYFLRLQVTNP